MDWVDLPELALIRVLNYLPAHDQLNARLVCKYWKLITDSSVHPDELILFMNFRPRPVYWFHDGREVDLANAFSVSNWTALNGEFFLRHFRQVRRLMVVHKLNSSSRKFLEHFQTSFPELRHLQFNFIGSKSSFLGLRGKAYKANFQLDNLRTFYSQADDMPLGLHCPRLSELYVYTDLKIDETINEQTRQCIQNLRLLLVQKLTYPSGFEFSNLEVFYFNEPSPAISLSDFPRLKELHYFDGFSWVHAEIENHLRSLLAQKRRLKKDELRIFFDGFELDDRDNDFNALDVGYLDPEEPICSLKLNESIVRFVNDAPLGLKFDLLSKDLVMSDALDDELADLQEGDKLVESMFRSVESIDFKRPLTKQSLSLFELSNKFRYVSVVHVDVELSQTLLNQLPDALPHLVMFSYHPKSIKNRSLKFEFIARFKSLDYLSMHRLLSIEELRLILEDCKFLNFINLHRSNRVFMGIFKPSYFHHEDVDPNTHVIEWNSSDFVIFARAKFTTEELFDYLEASRWIGKQLDEEEEQEFNIGFRLDGP